jgi:hypothetical protein
VVKKTGNRYKRSVDSRIENNRDIKRGVFMQQRKIQLFKHIKFLKWIIFVNKIQKKKKKH